MRENFRSSQRWRFLHLAIVGVMWLALETRAGRRAGGLDTPAIGPSPFVSCPPSGSGYLRVHNVGTRRVVVEVETVPGILHELTLAGHRWGLIEVPDAQYYTIAGCLAGGPITKEGYGCTVDTIECGTEER
jgi:hypothetical protein